MVKDRVHTCEKMLNLNLLKAPIISLALKSCYEIVYANNSVQIKCKTKQWHFISLYNAWYKASNTILIQQEGK